MTDTNSAEYPGLPDPPPVGAKALPAGTFDGTTVLVTGGGHRARQGDRVASSPASAPTS